MEGKEDMGPKLGRKANDHPHPLRSIFIHPLEGIGERKHATTIHPSIQVAHSSTTVAHLVKERAKWVGYMAQKWTPSVVGIYLGGQATIWVAVMC